MALNLEDEELLLDEEEELEDDEDDDELEDDDDELLELEELPKDENRLMVQKMIDIDH